MSEKRPLLAAETGTLSTASPNPHIDLSGTAVAATGIPFTTFKNAADDGSVDFNSGDLFTVIVIKDESNVAIYSGATWTDASPDIVDLSTATLKRSFGTIANNDSVSCYAGEPELDQARTWTTAQALAGGVSGGVTTVASAGTAQTVSLDGKIHFLTLDSASSCTITGSPIGSAYSSALLLIKQDATGSRAMSFASGTKTLASQTLNTTANKYSAWVLWSHDGSTVFASPAGAES